LKLQWRKRFVVTTDGLPDVMLSSCFQFNNWINWVFGNATSSGATVPDLAYRDDTK